MSGAAAPRVPPPSLRIGFILARAFTLSAFASFVDALRLAADDGDSSRPLRCRWSVMAATPQPLRASCRLEVRPTAALQDPSSFDYIAVVGGLLHAGAQIDDATVAYLRGAAASGVPLIGICTGSFILARAGLMKGRRICVSWYHHRDFQAEFPDLEAQADQLYIVDRDRITCAGGTAAADLAAFLIERHVGRAAALKTLHIMQIDRARPAREAQPRPPSVASVGDERVRRAVLIMEQSLSAPLPLATIARRLGVSPRQLERLFRAETGRGPREVYAGLRLRYADWLLRNTRRPITIVAQECGFADGAHFARRFRRAFGCTPSSLRLADGSALAVRGAGPEPEPRIFT